MSTCTWKLESGFTCLLYIHKLESGYQRPTSHMLHPRLSMVKFDFFSYKKTLTSLKRWRFLTVNSSRVSQIGLKNTQRSKELSKKVQVKFLNYCPLYIKKNVYRDDKLEKDWKCKARRKTNWKRIQSVKQVGKRSGVWKKMGKEYFLKKNRKLPIKIFFWKKKYFKTHPIHMTMHVCDASWSGGICRHKKLVD